MKFGILASHQYPRDEGLQERLGELFDLIEYASEAGYDSVFAINHFLANLATPQVISMTAKLVEISGDMRVGTGILLLPFFNPIHVAEEFATLDQLSGGRMILGVGAGYRDDEFNAFHVDKRTRGGQLADAVDLIRALWSDEVVQHDGPYHQLHGQRIGVPPVQPGGPPIWIGAGAEAAVRRAARKGDAWLTPGNSPDPDWSTKALRWHDEALVQTGRSSDGREYPIVMEMYCAETTDKARAECLPYIRDEYFTYSNYRQLAWQKTMFNTLWEEVFIIGSPDDLVARIQGLADQGFTQVIFRPFWTGMPAALSNESVRLIAEEVIPRFRVAS